MSYQGGQDYLPFQTVDETASDTDMMGAASVLNQAQAQRDSWKSSPAKQLFMLWVLVIIVYMLVTSVFFRRFTV